MNVKILTLKNSTRHLLGEVHRQDVFEIYAVFILLFLYEVIDVITCDYSKQTRDTFYKDATENLLNLIRK